jgi:hypothetical protein
MKNQFPEFCTFNTGTTITCPTESSIYVTSALGNISGSAGVITVGSNQVLQPLVPIKFDSSISGAARTIFYYFGD